MDTKLKAKWVKALRSGKYKKGTEYLKYEDDNGQVRYCCLGVLCEVAKIPFELEHGHGYNINGINDIIVEEIVEEYNLGITPDQQADLADLNDNKAPKQKKGFKWIADRIEKGTIV